MTNELVDQVMRKCHITYSDADVSQRIEEEIMPTAERELRDLLGIHDESFSFAEPGTENLLFLAYCFYEWNDAAEDFENNYARLIGRCREKWMVRQYVEEQEAATDV